MQLSLFAEKRWLARRERWVTPRDAFTPAGYAVDVVAKRLARACVEREHYSGSFPAARLSVGLWGPGPTLEGVAVFSVPMSQAVLPRWTGPEHGAAVELGRFVCAPSVRFNGESWFLARALRALAREKGVRAVLSFADPMERHTLAGELTKGAHYGTIYQAKGALFAGRTRARRVLLAPDGSLVTARTLSKIRNEERGLDYAVRRLRALGAGARFRGESWATWVDRVTTQPPFRRVRHPGTFAYVFGLDTGAAAALSAYHEGGSTYPKPLTSRAGAAAPGGGEGAHAVPVPWPLAA